MHRDTIEIVPEVMEEASQENIDTMKEEPDGLRIEKLVSGREKRQTLVVRSISKNHTQ